PAAGRRGSPDRRSARGWPPSPPSPSGPWSSGDLLGVDVLQQLFGPGQGARLGEGDGLVQPLPVAAVEGVERRGVEALREEALAEEPEAVALARRLLLFGRPVAKGLVPLVMAVVAVGEALDAARA